MGLSVSATAATSPWISGFILLAVSTASAHSASAPSVPLRLSPAIPYTPASPAAAPKAAASSRVRSNGRPSYVFLLVILYALATGIGHGKPDVGRRFRCRTGRNPRGNQCLDRLRSQALRRGYCRLQGPR